MVVSAHMSMIVSGASDMTDIVPSKKNNAVRLSDMLHAYDRRPFLDVVELFLRNQPSEEVVQELAKTAPQHWSAVLKTMANLGGYADQKVVTHKNDFEGMSELELMQFVRKARAELVDPYEALEAKKLEAIDVEAVPVPPKDKA